MNKLAVVLLGMGLSISGLTQAAGVGFVDLEKLSIAVAILSNKMQA